MPIKRSSITLVKVATEKKPPDKDSWPDEEDPQPPPYHRLAIQRVCGICCAKIIAMAKIKSYRVKCCGIYIRRPDSDYYVKVHKPKGSAVAPRIEKYYGEEYSRDENFPPNVCKWCDQQLWEGVAPERKLSWSKTGKRTRKTSKALSQHHDSIRDDYNYPCVM